MIVNNSGIYVNKGKLLIKYSKNNLQNLDWALVSIPDHSFPRNLDLCQ